MAKESEGTPTAQPATRPAETAASNPEDLDTNGRLPGWRGLLRQALDKTRQEQPATNRRELGRDRTRILFILVVAVITVLLFFLGVFSSPNRNKGRAFGRPGVPDLGKRITPGQQAASADGSVTPLLNAQNGNSENQDRDSVTAEEVGRTAHPSRPRTSSTTTPKNSCPYALGRIDFSDPVAKETRAASEPTDRREPSLVFVSNAAQSNNAAPARNETPAILNQIPISAELPVGTRLVARLQSVVSSAVKSPIVAAIEYNYERDGEIIIPAGAKAIGRLQQTDRSGYVAIRFDAIQMPDGQMQKIDASAMSLDHGPMKGEVSGKRTGTRFLVRAFTGLGTAATYLVGGGGANGFNGPLSESALLRDRIANNVGIAGDQELNNLAFNQNIIVTVPANTRFYLVMDNSADTSEPEKGATVAQPTLSTAEDLRELMQLRRELSEMYSQGGVQKLAQAPQQ